MNTSSVGQNGLQDARPGREATTGVNVPAGGGGPRRRRNGRREPEFRSYYDQPILNKPVWEAPDIPGYFFLGGLAGAAAVIAGASELTGRPALARVGKVGAAAAIQLSLVALIHDLGRRGRFLNMLRMIKVTSPMSVGTWLLVGFAPAATAAAAADITGLVPRVGRLATLGAAAFGPPVTTYTAVLVADTAVPAWHDGHRLMPFVFASSALASGAGLGLAAAPSAETSPLVPLAAAGGAAEVVLSKLMERRMGMVGEAYHQGKAKRYMRAAEVLSTTGALLAAASRGRRWRKAAAGAALLAGSVATRFGIFEAGIVSATDPKYTVVPQRERLEREERP